MSGFLNALGGLGTGLGLHTVEQLGSNLTGTNIGFSGRIGNNYYSSWTRPTAPAPGIMNRITAPWAGGGNRGHGYGNGSSVYDQNGGLPPLDGYEMQLAGRIADIETRLQNDPMLDKGGRKDLEKEEKRLEHDFVEHDKKAFNGVHTASHRPIYELGLGKKYDYSNERVVEAGGPMPGVIQQGGAQSYNQGASGQLMTNSELTFNFAQSMHTLYLAKPGSQNRLAAFSDAVADAREVWKTNHGNLDFTPMDLPLRTRNGAPLTISVEAKGPAANVDEAIIKEMLTWNAPFLDSSERGHPFSEQELRAMIAHLPAAEAALPAPVGPSVTAQTRTNPPASAPGASSGPSSAPDATGTATPDMTGTPAPSATILPLVLPAATGSAMSGEPAVLGKVPALSQNQLAALHAELIKGNGLAAKALAEHLSQHHNETGVNFGKLTLMAVAEHYHVSPDEVKGLDFTKASNLVHLRTTVTQVTQPQVQPQPTPAPQVAADTASPVPSAPDATPPASPLVAASTTAEPAEKKGPVLLRRTQEQKDSFASNYGAGLPFGPDVANAARRINNPTVGGAVDIANGTPVAPSSTQVAINNSGPAVPAH